MRKRSWLQCPHELPAKDAQSVGLLAAFVTFAATHAIAQVDTEQIDVEIVLADPINVPTDFAMRVRLTAITPDEPTTIKWRYGGEGQGGNVIRGMFHKPGVAADAADESHPLQTGQWSAPLSVASLAPRFPKKLFLTVTAGNPGKVIDRITRRRGEYSTDIVFQFEFTYQGKIVKTFHANGPDGGTATILIPAYRLVSDTKPDSHEFLDELTGVLEYATRRAVFLENLPWADWPLPKKYAIVNNAGGYGAGSGYGIRTTDKAVTYAELRSLRQLGVNGFRSPPEFIVEILAGGGAEAKKWNRAMLSHVMGFPVPSYRAGRQSDPQSGCPFGDNVAAVTKEQVEESLQSVLDLPVDEVWGLTVDEIGTVIDRSAEKKGHLAACPRCARGFQRWLQTKGLTPGDFGASDWSEVRPLNVWDKDSDRPWLHDRGAALAAYFTRDFNNYVTAMLFTELKNAFDDANRAKRQALDSGETDTPVARQPRIHSFALRGNTFLMKGHSLDFFDFYRLADNAIVYETSNRGPRIWGWDSYLCDVQRVVAQKMNLAQGIYIKPHRGAPIQRMLSAVSRGDTMLYWYTYGPDYKKGDSFSQSDEALVLTSKAAHLLGKAEDALYGSKWAVPAEVAVVKPETTQRWMNLSGNPPHLMAAWENAKWIYSALQHAHVPVDPIDEQMLATEDLSQYKIIYANGSHITRAAASGLERYVKNGGTLYTSGWGLSRDEANGPLTVLQPVLGLRQRNEPEMWYTVTLYGATRIESYSEPSKRIAPVPEGAQIARGGLVQEAFLPAVGREVLSPDGKTEVLANFADGAPAITRHQHGKGEVYVAGFFPGLEYSAPVRRDDYDMTRDFFAARRNLVAAPALKLTRPVVDASEPLVEGVLLRNEKADTRAVTVANWAYRVSSIRQDPSGRRTPVVAHVPAEDVKITIRAAGDVRRVESCMLDRSLDFASTGDTIVVSLPRLEEGDALLLK